MPEDWKKSNVVAILKKEGGIVTTVSLLDADICLNFGTEDQAVNQ